MPTYTYAEVAARIAAAFPARPAPTVNALRNAVARRAIRGVAGGMPARSNSPAAPVALFDAEAIDRWIAQGHPWAVFESVVALWGADQRSEAIVTGRRAGLSWDELAQARSTAEGAPVSGEAVRRMAARLERAQMGAGKPSAAPRSVR